MRIKEFESYLKPVEGPDRDLNFAIKTGSKKTIGLINKLSQAFDRFDSASLFLIVQQLFVLTASIDINDRKSKQIITSIGIFFLKFSCTENAATSIFKEWSNRLLSIDYNNQEQCQIAYQWLLLLNQKDGSSRSPKTLRTVFDTSQNTLDALYEKLFVSFNVRELFYDKSGIQPGYKLIETFASSYFYHSDSCHEHFESWIIDCVSEEINFGNNLILSVLQRSENHARIAAQLLDFYVRSMLDDDQHGMGWWLLLDLFDADIYPAEQLNSIINYLDTLMADWTVDQTSHAINCLYSLNHDDTEKAQQLLKRCKGAKKLAERLITKGESHAVEVLSTLLHGSLVPGYRFPTGGETQFEDINFKLIIINELMYEKKLLTPAFNLMSFAKEFDHREISTKGYDIIPEALEYMTGLKIPEELMSSITELTYDPASEIYRHLIPYWDGEEDIFEVSSLKDLSKLHNVKKIQGFNQSLVDSISSILVGREIKVLKAY